MNIFKKALTIGSGKLATELNAQIDSINSKEEAVSKLTDIEIKESFQKLKVDIDQTDKHDIEVEAFSLVREAAKRTINERHYDVQLFGGLVLLRNKIAEMKTGEGKTLVSTLPISLMSLYGKGVHVVTVNDYLAKRDAEWMQPIYNFLGLDVGLIFSNQEYQQKIDAYKSYEEAIESFEAEEIGWAFWPWKKLESISTPYAMITIENYQLLINYFRGD